MNYFRICSMVAIAILAALHIWVYSGEAESSEIYQTGMCKMVEDGYYPPEFCKR